MIRHCRNFYQQLCQLFLVSLSWWRCCDFNSRWTNTQIAFFWDTQHKSIIFIWEVAHLTSFQCKNLWGRLANQKLKNFLNLIQLFLKILKTKNFSILKGGGGSSPIRNLPNLSFSGTSSHSQKSNNCS